MSGLDFRKTLHRHAVRLGILVLVHSEAFYGDPMAYLRAIWAWVMGKKLRARLGLAPLLGGSRHAYDYWLAYQLSSEGLSPPTFGEGARIVALIAMQDIDDELRNLLALEGMEIQTIHDAAGLLAGNEGCDLWLLPMVAGDILAKGAGAKYRLAISNADQATNIIYADDDLINSLGKRHSPHFKPDWNAELFRHHDYCTGAAIVRASSVRAEHISSPEMQTDGWAKRVIQDGVESTADAGGEVVHVQEVLHHRQVRPLPKLPLADLQVGAEAQNSPSVSVIVPTRNHLDLIRTCLEGVANTEYDGRVEIIVIDNGSDDPATQDYLANLSPEFARVIRDDSPFNFAALNNRAVKESSRELLCFCNNDLEITDPQWLTKLVQQTMHPDVGAVGPQLLYPDGRIQHAGVVTGIGGAAAHAHRFLRPEQEGYFSRHNLPQFVTAVTAACMLVSRDKFEAVGGFDAARFAVSFNDVDLCLRLAEKGWKSFYEPRVQLVHHESISRGFDRDAEGAARQMREVAALQERWGTALEAKSAAGTPGSRDPYHHPQLSPLSEQFVVRI